MLYGVGAQHCLAAACQEVSWGRASGSGSASASASQYSASASQGGGRPAEQPVRLNLPSGKLNPPKSFEEENDLN